MELPQMNNKSYLIASDRVDHEIPIAARFKGPGPAAYTLPSTMGLNAKTGKRAPAYSFGTKIDFDSLEKKCKFLNLIKDIYQTPGPNAFFPQATRTGRNKGPAFSLQSGFKKGMIS
jgi:hypothetical protein